MKILIYGDSNTYGYDPANLTEQRYPLEQRWTYLLQQINPEKWEIIPEGMNGRKLPDLRYDAERIRRLLSTLRPGDLFCVMLGTNDILLTLNPDADIAISKMLELLEFLTNWRDPSDILIIAPPYIGRREIPDRLYQQYYLESKRMNAGFKTQAEAFHANFTDAGPWEAAMSADLVHLSEKGHRQFAEKLGEYLQERGW